MTPPLELSKIETNHLVEVIATVAANAPGLSPKEYFRDLVDRTTLQQSFRLQLSGIRGENPPFDARKLVNWALSKPVNPADPRYTTLGSFLQELLNDLDLSERSWIVALIFARNLYLDKGLLGGLRADYNVPDWSAKGGEEELEAEPGEEFEWWGPEADAELQSYDPPESEYLDVGELEKALLRAASVCRIEFNHIDRVGTGFLIAPNLVLTNYHVLKYTPGDDMDENGRQAVLYFGKVSLGEGKEAEGRKFSLVQTKPVLESSPVKELDFALLQVEDKVTSEPTIHPSPISLQVPAKKDALHILQHPRGKEMKLARSASGVVAVREDLGKVQYYTRAGLGSSGSPCYNKDWEVVALHHMELSVGLGVRREGILFKNIHEHISKYM